MNFKNAQEYSKNAKIQQIISKDLINFAQKDLIDAKTILDVGCGTGFVAKEIKKHFSNKIIDGLDPSKEMLELGKYEYSSTFNVKIEDFTLAKYDLILSSMCLQWVNEVEKNIKKLANAGNFYFTMPLEGNLQEINDAFLIAGVQSPLLKSQKISIEPAFTKEYKEYFSSILLALKSFNMIGATNLQSSTPSHNQIKLLERYFNGEMTWKIGFYSI